MSVKYLVPTAVSSCTAAGWVVESQEVVVLTEPVLLLRAFMALLPLDFFTRHIPVG